MKLKSLILALLFMGSSFLQADPADQEVVGIVANVQGSFILEGPRSTASPIEFGTVVYQSSIITQKPGSSGQGHVQLITKGFNFLDLSSFPASFSSTSIIPASELVHLQNSVGATFIQRGVPQKKDDRKDFLAWACDPGYISEDFKEILTLRIVSGKGSPESGHVNPLDFPLKAGKEIRSAAYKVFDLSSNKDIAEGKWKKTGPTWELAFKDLPPGNSRHFVLKNTFSLKDGTVKTLNVKYAVFSRDDMDFINLEIDSFAAKNGLKHKRDFIALRYLDNYKLTLEAIELRKKLGMKTQNIIQQMAQ